MFKEPLLYAICMALAALTGCASRPTLMASSCPPFPTPPPSLMQPPPTLDLVPPNLRPTRMPAPDSVAMPR